MSADWHRWSLAEAAQRLRNRQLSAVELAGAVLARIAERDGEVRAFLTVGRSPPRRSLLFRAGQATFDRLAVAIPLAFPRDRPVSTSHGTAPATTTRGRLMRA